MLMTIDEEAKTALSRLVTEPLEIHSMARWIIARVEPGAERKALEWLLRFGFEGYYPKGKFITTVPLRKLPSKTRHKRAAMKVIERERPAYPGYILVRRFVGDFDLNRLFDIPHMGGVCCFGPDIATLPDFEVEMLRLQEARGAFNQYASVAAERAHCYQIAADVATQRTWTGESRIVGRTCESGTMVTFSQRFGRITHVIMSAPAVDHMVPR